MNKGRHRKQPPRHRRMTTGDHLKRLSGLAAVFGVLVGALFAVPMPADAEQPLTYARTMSDEEATAPIDYGSGILGNWSANTPTRRGNPATADVALFGDSITARGWADVDAYVKAEGRTLYVDAWPSRPTTPTVDEVLRLKAAGTLPKRIVMATAANDIFNPPVVAAQVKRLQDGLGPEYLVLWVDAQVSRTKYSTAIQIADQRNTGWVNAQIHAGIKAPNKVISWSAFLNAKPWRLSPAGYLEDGVHPWMTAVAGVHSDGTAAWGQVIWWTLGPIVKAMPS